MGSLEFRGTFDKFSVTGERLNVRTCEFLFSSTLSGWFCTAGYQLEILTSLGLVPIHSRAWLWILWSAR